MFERIRQIVLRVMRVPAEPTPPIGAPGSVRIFRAGRNLYKLRLLRWGFAQIGAIIGIVVSLTFINYLEREVNVLRTTPPKATPTPPAATAPPPSATPASSAPVAPPVANSTVNSAPSSTNTSAAPATKPTSKRTSRDRGSAQNHAELVRILERAPSWIFLPIHLFEYGAILLFLVQIPFSYAAARLEFELRWYIVTDRSLRIRSGLLAMQESTMSFANLQQVSISQGPLQRFLGLADLRVQSAGGGGDAKTNHHGDESLHTGVFHGVENAPEIRDLILDRLRHFREAGLGDPEDRSTAPASLAASHASSAPLASPSTDASALAAARELLAETRALRQALAS